MTKTETHETQVVDVAGAGYSIYKVRCSCGWESQTSSSAERAQSDAEFHVRQRQIQASRIAWDHSRYAQS